MLSCVYSVVVRVWSVNEGWAVLNFEFLAAVVVEFGPRSDVSTAGSDLNSSRLDTTVLTIAAFRFADWRRALNPRNSWN